MFDRTAPFTSIETQSILGLSDADYDSAIRSGYLQSSGVIRVEPPSALMFHTCWDMLRFKILSEDLMALRLDASAQRRLDETLDNIYDRIVDEPPDTIVAQFVEETYLLLAAVAQTQGYWTARGISNLVRAIFRRIFDENEGEMAIMRRHLDIIGYAKLVAV